MMKCEEEMFRPSGAKCLGRLLPGDSKMAHYTLTAIYCPCSVQYQARLMSIVPDVFEPASILHNVSSGDHFIAVCRRT